MELLKYIIESMVRLIRMIVYAAIGAAVIYMPCVFYSATFDIAKWADNIRFVAASFGCVLMILGIAIAAWQNEKKLNSKTKYDE